MKKVISFILFVTLMFTTVPVFALPTFEMSFYSSNANIYSVDVDSDSGVAFIETKSSNSELAFTHKYESNFYYSTIRSDILVIDYFKSNRYPVFRTWIDYRADKALNIYAVSFVIDGKTYTFSDVADRDRIEKLDNGVSEKLLIKYGSANSDFFASVAADSLSYAFSRYGGEGDSEVETPQMKMILHGTEDVEVDIPANFWVDFSLLALSMTENDYLGYIGDNDGTPCKIK